MRDEVGAHYTGDAEQFFVRVRELLPSFVPIDDEGRDDWTDDGGPLGYIRVAALAWHLGDIAGRGDWDLVKPVLELVEATIASADPYTRDLMVVGLLEDLQNAALQSDGRVRLVSVRALLGPLGVKAWDEPMRFWHGDGQAARDRLPPGSLPAEV